VRRKEKEIHDKDELEKILKKGTICRLGLCDDNVPYIVPMNYGYSDGNIYFHSANSGRKIEMMRKNSYACFEIEGGTEIVKDDKACSWGMRYKSIIGYGKLEEVEDLNEKMKGLSLLMKHYSLKEKWDFPEKSIKKVLVLKLKIDTMSGKRSGVE
jgi:nitroimidazol reductase NimA-like FMN-containing flavoprotein (pyridoxamine 5'-phosphate oxidase superfamily)